MKKLLDKLYNLIEIYFINEYSHDIGEESFFSAMACYDNKEYTKALELYKIALTYQPNSDATYFNMGNVYFVQKDYDQALIHYKKAAHLCEDSLNVNKQIAHVYFRQKKYEEALIYYVASEKKDEPDEDLYTGMGYCYYALQDYENSILMYKKAVEINPKTDYFFLSIALNYRLLEDYAESIYFYKKALTYEDKEETIKELAYVYYLNAQYDKSKTLFHTLIENNEHDNYAIYMIGVLLYDEKKYSGALDYLLQSLEGEEIGNEVLLYIASSYTYLNKFEKSIEFYFKLLELESNKPCYYCNVFEMELLLNRPFTKSLEDEFIKKFRDNKESFILYSYLKILESIILGKEVFLEKWKATYNEVDFIRWEFETLENWMHSYEDEEIKVKLLEALKCFKREDNT